MGKCATCGSVIVFGGKKQGDQRYCNDRCLQRAQLVTVAAELPDYQVQHQVTTVHQGLCPRCQGPGPVDVHTNYRVWSALFITSWVSRPLVACRSCGIKAQVGSALFSLLLGWWGFPWGLLVTPVQIVRNVVGMVRAPDPAQPSAQLHSMVRMQMAGQVLAAQQHHQQQRAA